MHERGHCNSGDKTEQNETKVGRNDGPASAGSLSARLAAANPDTVDKSPPDERRHDFTEEEEVTKVRIELSTLLNRFALITRSCRHWSPEVYVVGIYGFGKWFILISSVFTVHCTVNR